MTLEVLKKAEFHLIFRRRRVMKLGKEQGTFSSIDIPSVDGILTTNNILVCPQ